MADERDWPNGWDVVRIPFCFVPHGAPEPTEWMARHPNWFKIPATFIPRGAWPPALATPETGAVEGTRVEHRSEYRSDAKPPSELHTSRRGKEFVFVHEVGANPRVTAHTHWPAYASGVTIGPGYDMKLRSQEQIVYDLMSIGVDQKHARALAAGKPRRASSEPGLTGEAAKEFAERHAKDVTLTAAQQRALLDHVISIYEADVRRLVHVPLTQDQFDALVSFDYNMGARRLGEIAILLNIGDYKQAANALEHFNDGDPGLRKRRRAEATIFRAPR